MNKTFPLIIILVLLLRLNLTAQSCGGSYRILATDDFGRGTTNFGPPLATGTTTYIYNDGTLIEPCGSIFLPRPTTDGMYALCNNPYNAWQVCNVTTIVAPWINTTDHTGNGGYMLICNAAGTPDIFYQKTYNVCAGTNCSFSIWASNLCRLSNPCIIPIVQIDMVNPVNNQVLASINSGGSLTTIFENQLNWKKLQIDFSVPVGLSQVKMVVRNLQTGNSGNDLALDDVSFSLCVPNSTITSSEYCLGNSTTLQLQLQSGIFITPQYQWEISTNNGISFADIPNAVTSSYTTPPVTALSVSYLYRVRYAGVGNINSNNCNAVSVPYKLPPPMKSTPASLFSNSPICEASDLMLQCSNCVANTFTWIGPNGFQSTVSSPTIKSVSSLNAGQYNLVSSNGCVLSSSLEIFVKKNPVGLLVSNEPCLNNTLQLTFTGVTNASYLWTGPVAISDTTSSVSIPIFNSAKFGKYNVKVNKDGCSKDFSIDVNTANGTPIYLPNAFTPNDDNVNDFYYAKALQPNSFIRLILYNRYGEKVFENDDINKGWNGTYKGLKQETGTFVWILYSFDCNRKKVMTKGSFLLLR